MNQSLRKVADMAIGFMPENEGLALYRAGLQAADLGALLEIGGYCGKSAIFLGAAARERGSTLFSIDHHRGSEEQQPGEEYFDARTVDPSSGRVDTLLLFRRTIEAAGLEEHVVAVVGRSETIAPLWTTPVGMVFIDGGHSPDAVRHDYEAWSPRVVRGGILAFHDIYPDPDEGGSAPFDVYSEVVASGAFEVMSAEGSLRLLKRVRDPLADL